jgi:HEAT repeat protein
MIEALGRTKDQAQVEFLLEQALRSPDDDIMAAAGGALAEFRDLPIKPRRELVKDLVSRYGEWHMKATQPEPSDPNAPVDFTPQNARQTLNKIEPRWTATLQALTGQTFSSAPDWQRWLNKNKEWQPPP